MAHLTEAAGLLRSGALYPRRVGFRGPDGEDGFAGFKPGGFSLYYGDAPIYHFDFEGRWQRAFVAGTHYLKGLDASVRSIDRERVGESMILRRRPLSESETSGLDRSIRDVAAGMIEALDAGRLDLQAPPTSPRSGTIGVGELREFLGRVAAWDGPAWAAHRELYEAAYGPLPFLPPDALNAVVLQATVGHAGGRAFGGGRPAEFRARRPGEFEDHARRVADLLGRRLSQCRDIFLGGPDVLRRPVEEILADLAATARVFPVRPEIGRPKSSPVDESASRIERVHAFLDDYRAPLPDLDGWRRLREAHLGRVTLGIDSGDPATRAAKGPTRDDRDLIRTARDLRSAGIDLGVVVLVDPSGRSSAPSGCEATAGLVSALGLGPGEIVSLVDARGLDETAAGEADRPDDAAVAGWVAGFKARLTAATPSKGPRVVVYNPDKQWT